MSAPAPIVSMIDDDDDEYIIVGSQSTFEKAASSSTPPAADQDAESSGIPSTDNATVPTCSHTQPMTAPNFLSEYGVELANTHDSSTSQTAAATSIPDSLLQSEPSISSSPTSPDLPKTAQTLQYETDNLTEDDGFFSVDIRSTRSDTDTTRDSSTKAGQKHSGMSSAIAGLMKALRGRGHDYDPSFTDPSPTVDYTNVDTYKEGHPLLQISNKGPGMRDRRSRIRKAVIKIREEDGEYAYDEMSDYFSDRKTMLDELEVHIMHTSRNLRDTGPTAVLPIYDLASAFNAEKYTFYTEYAGGAGPALRVSFTPSADPRRSTAEISVPGASGKAIPLTERYLASADSRMMRLFSGTIEVGFDRDGFAKPSKATKDWSADCPLPDMSGQLSPDEQIDFGVIKKNHMELIKRNAKSLASVIADAAWQSTATSAAERPRVVVSGPLDGGYYNKIRLSQTRAELKHDKEMIFGEQCLSSMSLITSGHKRQENDPTDRWSIYLGLDFDDQETVLEEREVKAGKGGGESKSELKTANAEESTGQSTRLTGVRDPQWRKITRGRGPRVRVRA